MIGRFGYGGFGHLTSLGARLLGAMPVVGEQSFLGGIRTERKVKPIKRSKDKLKSQLQAKRNNKRVIVRLKRRRRKLAKASRVRNRRCR